MIRILIISIVAASLLGAQDYRWPIRASQSLSATFCEYRSGHLHAGVDIKTWGEMNVPCLAIADGYIERIIVGYNGYGRGLFLRLNDGNLAVYGHLELFIPNLESLVNTMQLENDRYSVRLDFTPDEFPVKAGQIIAYSGTSGTEHPHLHFEVRDSLDQVINPQLMYPDIKDTKAPQLDELMLIPIGSGSRLNESQLPIIVDLSKSDKPVRTTGPFKIAINAHDRSDGTYNKYNIYSASTFLNDSLVFSREFDRALMQKMDNVDHIYPGGRGKYGWRYMSMFNTGDSLRAPFAPPGMDGIITTLGLASLDVQVADISGNQTSRKIMLRYETPANWELKEIDSTYIITRSYGQNGFEKIQFYTGDNQYLPSSETLYRLNSTTWILDVARGKAGIRALGAVGGSIKWVIPPEGQRLPTLTYSWINKSNGFILRLESEAPYIFPVTAMFRTPLDSQYVELRQTAETMAETKILPVDHRAEGVSIQLQRGSVPGIALALDPFTPLEPSSSETLSLNQIGVKAILKNSGSSKLYFKFDTVQVQNNDWIVIGAGLNVIHSESSKITGQLSFSNVNTDSTFSIFAPGSKNGWKRLNGADSLGQFHTDIRGGGSFFLLQDNEPPTVKAQGNYRDVRRGDRLVFDVTDNLGSMPRPPKALAATLDGTRFFPDFNPLRKELSFHVPPRLGTGRHVFELAAVDESGNVRKFVTSFNVIH